MEHLRQRRIIDVLLQCSLLVGLVRMEEVFNTTPPPLRTNFSCLGRGMGFYADVEANCKVYHTCDDHANKFSYRCPEETAFRQDALICDHAHLVDCQATILEPPRITESVQAEQEKADTRSAFFNVPASESQHNRRSFSRSFQVIQHPEKYPTDKYSQPGFIFSASVFLRDRDSSRNEPSSATKSATKSATDRRVCDIHRERSDSKNTVTTFPTIRPYASNNFPPKADVPNRSASFLLDKDQFAMIQSAQSRGRISSGYRGRTLIQTTESSRSAASNPPFRIRELSARTSAFNPLSEKRNSQRTFPTSVTDSQIQKSTASSLPGLFSPYNRDYPYLETLRSIQANSRTGTTFTSSSTAKSVTEPRSSLMSTITKAPLPATTEIPVHALTVSLKPLVPNELQYDPYYPRMPTSTEAYYTPNLRSKGYYPSTYSTPASWSGIKFQIPAVLPDLNMLDDLVDRRRLFYIPRVRVA